MPGCGGRPPQRPSGARCFQHRFRPCVYHGPVNETLNAAQRPEERVRARFGAGTQELWGESLLLLTEIRSLRADIRRRL